jgi:exodeoxyribonuclease VII large subunit
VRVLIAPCRVQGDGAASEIAAAIGRLDRAGVDVILVGRGGGSLEDLWAYNEEIVARAIAACGTPVITGIGHEIDVTIADLVADRRAPTPSAAAELAVQDRLDLSRRLGSLARRLGGSARLHVSRGRERLRALRDGPAMRRVPRRLADLAQARDDLDRRARAAIGRAALDRRRRLERLRDRLSPLSLRQRVRERRARTDHAGHRLRSAGRARVDGCRAEVRRLADLLGSFSPLAVLARGYAICQDRAGRVVRDHDQVAAEDPVRVRLHRGALDCRVVRPLPPAEET